jgi:hypothetical protein
VTERKPKTYEATIRGRKARVTVPEDPKPEDRLIDALRENLSPHAVAAIASCLQPARTNDPNVDREVQWFIERLAETLGGWDRQNRLAEELAL